MAVKKQLSHIDAAGRARMVDVGEKAVSAREAKAEAWVRMQPATLALLRSGKAPKGDVLAVARIAGIQAAKRTPSLIPLCHHVQLTGVVVELSPSGTDAVHIIATARAADRTGVEMEALVAASTAALTLYDMLKAVDRGMVIERVCVLEKRGGKNGDYRRQAAEASTPTRVRSKSPRSAVKKKTALKGIARRA